MDCRRFVWSQDIREIEGSLPGEYAHRSAEARENYISKYTGIIGYRRLLYTGVDAPIMPALRSSGAVIRKSKIFNKQKFVSYMKRARLSDSREPVEGNLQFRINGTGFSGNGRLKIL